MMVTSYYLLSISLMLVCIGFVHISVKKISTHHRVMIAIMWFVIFLFVDNLIGGLMDQGTIVKTESRAYLERCFHYAFSVAIYSNYAYFLYCIVDHFHYYPRWKKQLMFIPCAVIYVILFTTPWTHLAFRIEDGVFYKGILFYVIIVIKDTYAILATIRAIYKRRLLPKVFGYCVILMACFSVIQLIILQVTGNDFAYYCAMIVNVVSFVLATTVVEFYKDSQTNLLNKEAFLEYADHEIGKKYNKAVYLIKLKNYDYLKENCHETVLQKMIQQLAEVIKENAMISATYYLGSGRFTIVTTKYDKFSEEEFLKLLDARTRESFELNGARIDIKLFVAIINLEDGAITKENFYRYFGACDDLRYRSEDHVEVINSENFGINQLQRYKAVEEAVERAIVEKEFTMYYQPIIDAKTGKVVSAEALIRLYDRVLGFVSPEEFIPISESNGKIIEISEFVIDSVFRFTTESLFKELGLEFVEMNLSVMQCMDKNLCEKLQYYIYKHNVDPKRINLEITETATNFDENRLKEQLSIVKKLGFTFSLDDYGTGYSNLVRVLEYPVDIIKLDKTIIWSAFHDKDNYITLKNLISMFHDVRRKIVAEGVESEEQRNSLIELGCDYFQGYFYSKPIPEKEFLAFANKINH